MARTGITGFTLAELLISLAILGVIATFTIPKVLQSQQDGKYKAIAKEAAAMVAEAYTNYKLKNTLSATTSMDDLSKYFNYVKIDTSTWVDDAPSFGSYSCSSGTKCFKLHNGAMLSYNTPAAPFGGTNPAVHYLNMYLDPDGGTNNGSSQGKYPALIFIIYYNGRVATANNNDPAYIPSWFSWN